MANTKPLTIQADVEKVVSLYENDAIDLEEAKKLLKQFSKEALVAELLDFIAEEGIEEDKATINSPSEDNIEDDIADDDDLDDDELDL